MVENSFNKGELIIPKTNKPLGEILIEAGLISASQLEIALQQQQEEIRRIGEILASHNWIKQQTADFFAERWAKLLEEKPKKPLVYYLRDSGLLNENQIAAILAEQKQQKKPIRFHRLAVERGYIKQITVDFFLANIFHIYHSNVFSFAKPYEILSRYNKGEKNFCRTELSKAPLVGVSLKKVRLDGSNLREANLSSCNLTNSSLKQTNLALANFIKAILTKVDFQRANLCQANLREAHLKDTNFTQANLQGADLTEAYLFSTNFAGANLKKAKLPTECIHEVYYNSKTIFDKSFNPERAGWIKIN